MSNQNFEALSISLTNFPQTLLLSNEEYQLNFVLKNNLNKEASYKINFNSKTLSLSNLDIFSERFDFSPDESKNVSIDLKPSINGMSDLDIEVIQIKVINHTNFKWKIRKKVEKGLIKKILDEKLIDLKDLHDYKKKLPKKLELSDNLSLITLEQAKKKIKKINLPPVLPPLRKVEREVSKEIIKMVPKTIDNVSKDANEPEMVEKTEIITEMITEMIQDPAPPELTSGEKDHMIDDVARSVFNNDQEYSFNILRNLLNKELYLKRIKQFIPVCIYKNFKVALSEILKIQDDQLKNEFLGKLAYSVAEDDPKEADMIIMNITDSSKCDDYLTHIIFAIAKLKPAVASNLIFQINNETLRNKVLFELIKLWDSFDKHLAVKSLKNLINNILSRNNVDFIKSCMILLAHLTDPQSVYDLINTFGSEVQKKFIMNLLQDNLKVRTKEILSKFEEEKILQLNFQFPSVSVKDQNKIIPSLKYLSSIGGNISADLLKGNITSNISLISSYNYGFSIYNNLYRSYIDLNHELGKTFSYFLFPTSNELEKDDKIHFNKLFEKYFSNQSTIFGKFHLLINLDFLPYLSKPTIIIEKPDPENNIANGIVESFVNNINNLKLENNFKGNIIINGEFFEKGEFNQKIKDLIKNPKFIVLNIVLDYNFLNQYDLLKKTLTMLIQ